jgi:acyl-CoA synthetase (AMP-forming)/AMP-acid ligase II
VLKGIDQEEEEGEREGGGEEEEEEEKGGKKTGKGREGSERGGKREKGMCKAIDGKLFRTGDIVVRIPPDPNPNPNPDPDSNCNSNRWGGSLVWLGRKDLQVKIRGVRVELEEVERVISSALLTEEGREVRDGLAVVALIDPQGDSQGDQIGYQLVLFIEEDLTIKGSNSDAIRRFLSEKIAPTFVPLLVFLVPKLPRTVTG